MPEVSVEHKGITVTSTTSSEEDIKKALGVEEPKAETTKEPDKAAEEVKEPEGESETPVKTEETETEKPKGKGGFQRRIDKLTKRNYQLEEEREELRTRLERLEANREVKSPTDDPKPRPEQFSDKPYEDYVEALGKWTVRQELKAQAKEEAEKSEQARTQEVFKSYNQRLSEARGRYEDFEEVVGQDIAIPNSAKLAVIELENGPDIAYFLGKHPEVCEKLVEMSDVQAVAEIGAIASVLRQNTEPNKEEKASKVATKAPEPIKPVTGSSTKSTVPLDQLDYRSYRKIRDQQEKSRYG